MRSARSMLWLGFVSSFLFAGSPVAAGEAQPQWIGETVSELETELIAEHDEVQRDRLRRGMKQVASFWRAEDGDRPAFEEFVRVNFARDQATLDAMFDRFQRLLEQIGGHMREISIELRRQSDLDRGPIFPFDQVFAGYDPAAHLTDDFFANKLAFTVLLNFPLTTLEERLGEGMSWTRRQWAEARLAQQFSRRVPAEVQQEISRAAALADQYISEYNVWMHHLLDAQGERLFPPGLRLLSHWNLRDELKASYADQEHGLAKQRMIQKVMERIVTQEIPEIVIDNPHVDWNPYSNEVTPAAVNDSGSEPPADLVITNAAEPDTRYANLLATFQASRLLDPYSPTAPTLIARRFDENREIPEERVEEVFVQVLTSPLLSRVARLIESRLGRPLEPFDIWYNGFLPRGAYSEAELDRLVSERYPTAEAYEKDMPRMLKELGFPEERADHLAASIVVEAARGSGHAAGAGMRSAKSRLRTRVASTGMDYKGFSIAVHEMGHNVEQTISLQEIDYFTLEGVPNTAFTEAVAFVFQARDLELLGLPSPDAGSRALRILDDFWGAAEIAAVALVDMRVWHWMYDHPEATAGELKAATRQIAREVWNSYYAPIFGVKDVELLGIYSHMIHSFLYLPDYPMGHLIAVQVEEQIEKAGAVGPEVERMCKAGNVAPDLWMRNATGSTVGSEALLAATERALEQILGDES